MMPESRTESVLIPGVTVEVDMQRDGEPLVIVMTRNVAPGQAALVVSTRGMDESQLCAVLGVIKTTIEERPTRPGEAG